LEWNNYSPGLAAQPPAVQAGAAQACRLSPSLRLCLVPACKQSLHAFKPARGMPRKLACSGLQAKLALFRPASTACLVPACKHSLHAFKPARGMPRKPPAFTPP